MDIKLMEIAYQKLLKNGYLEAISGDWKTRYVIFTDGNKLDVKIIDEKTLKASIDTVFTKPENYGDKADFDTFVAIYCHIITNINF